MNAPVEGAILTTRLAPASEGDVVGWVAERLRVSGWDPVDFEGIDDEVPSDTWIMVELWALPPNHDEIVAKREARKRKVA